MQVDQAVSSCRVLAPHQNGVRAACHTPMRWLFHLTGNQRSARIIRRNSTSRLCRIRYRQSPHT
jgi:hypothetical protein